MKFCAIACLWASVDCGYRPVYAQSDAQKLAVGAGLVLVPETIAVQSALSGARAELAAAGRLAPGSSFPKLAIDVLRIDERSREVHVQLGQPTAAGMSIAVVVRARLLTGPDGDPSIDTGDVRRAVSISGDADPRADSAAREQAVRSAAEQAGRASARIALGLPEPNDQEP